MKFKDLLPEFLKLDEEYEKQRDFLEGKDRFIVEGWSIARSGLSDFILLMHSKKKDEVLDPD